MGQDLNPPADGFAVNTASKRGVVWTVLTKSKTDKYGWDEFTNLDGTPEQAPTKGVICIIQTQQDGDMDFISGWDVYGISQYGRWKGAGIDTLAFDKENGIPFYYEKKGYGDDTQIYFYMLRKLVYHQDFPQLDSRVSGKVM